MTETDHQAERRASEETGRGHGGRWLPGTSGNGRGRPPKGQSLAERVRTKLETEDYMPGQPYEARILEVLAQQAAKGDHAAIELLWARGYGKPVQAIQADVRSQQVQVCIPWDDGQWMEAVTRGAVGELVDGGPIHVANRSQEPERVSPDELLRQGMPQERPEDAG